MIVCSYFTSDYVNEAVNLKRSLLRHNIYSYFKFVSDKGSWLNNVQYKAEFMLAMLNRFNHPIVWLDADARVRQYPQILVDLYQTDVDFAAHWRDGSQLLSGTLFFNDTAPARALLADWVRLTRDLKDWTDQAILQQAVANLKTPFKVKMLPASYCQIFDTMAHHGEPVIEHMQASRKYKWGNR